MKIFIINLEHANERRESMERQMAALGLAYEFIPAVYGKHLSAEEKTLKYDDRKAFRHQCRSLVNSEIGIALSHVNIYRKIIKDKIDVACILEDDVILPSNFKDMVEKVNNNINRYTPELVLLSPAETGRRGVDIGDGYQMMEYKNGHFATSYIINNLGAQALVKELYPINDVADCWQRLHRHKIIDIKVLLPAMIVQDNEAFGCSTGPEVRAAYSYNVPQKIKFKIQRAFWVGIDLIKAMFNRNFRPYGGLKIKERA